MKSLFSGPSVTATLLDPGELAASDAVRVLLHASSAGWLRVSIDGGERRHLYKWLFAAADVEIRVPAGSALQVTLLTLTGVAVRTFLVPEASQRVVKRDVPPVRDVTVAPRVSLEFGPVFAGRVRMQLPRIRSGMPRTRIEQLAYNPPQMRPHVEVARPLVSVLGIRVRLPGFPVARRGDGS